MTLVTLWQHPILQPPTIIGSPSITIIVYLGSKYAASHDMIDLVSAEVSVQNPTCNKAANMQTPSNKAIVHYNLFPTIIST